MEAIIKAVADRPLSIQQWSQKSFRVSSSSPKTNSPNPSLASWTDSSMEVRLIAAASLTH